MSDANNSQPTFVEVTDETFPDIEPDDLIDDEDDLSPSSND